MVTDLSVTMDLKENNVPSSPAIVQIETLGIQYRLVKHPLGVKSASELTLATGFPIERMFKTLLLKNQFDEFLLCSLPCLQQIELKKLSTASGFTGLSMAHRKDIAPITGFECNTVSPFGLIQALPYYMDHQFLEDGFVYLGSGIFCVALEVALVDILNALHPICGDFSK